MKNEVTLVQTISDLEKCFPVMKELRPHLSLEKYSEIYENAHRTDGYEIAVINEGEKILALMGYRVLYDFVRGKHIYIDDLVVTKESQSRGLGAELLDYANEVAIKENCTTLRLCAGLENTRGMKFYERNNWTQRAVAYTKKVTS